MVAGDAGQGGKPRNMPQSIVPVTVVAIFALTIFRWVTLVESPMNLQFDEAQYWDWSRHLAFGYVSKPPLIAWIIWLTTKLFGNGESGIRAAAPLLHAVTALAIYATARKLYGPVPGFWSAIAYATLPSVSYSSLVISTDAVLLPFWALALGDWWRLLEKPGRVVAFRLGLWIGLGLLAKYAMVYFVGCAVVHLAASPDARRRLSWRHAAMSLAVAGLILAPNLLWNFSHGWATFAHTVNNADWEGTRRGGPVAALIFLGGQAAIFGPVFSMLLVWRLWTLRRTGRDDATLFLLSFGVPIVVIVTLQSVIAGAHMNWAAPAYVSLCIMVSALAFEHHPALARDLGRPARVVAALAVLHLRRRRSSDRHPAQAGHLRQAEGVEPPCNPGRCRHADAPGIQPAAGRAEIRRAVQLLPEGRTLSRSDLALHGQGA